jgi:phage-related protein
MTPYQVEFYETPNGTVPIAEFLDSITDAKLAAKVSLDLKLLGEYGPQLRTPLSKAVKKGIFELRIKQSSNIVRCLYFFFRGRHIVVTNGFIKKTQKIPSREIRMALKRKSDWERRQNDNS